MMNKFSFYKTIVLALASAVTLIAVSFAWFSTTNKNEIGALANYSIGDSVINVSYYKLEGTNYVPYEDDFTVSFDPAGGTVTYKMIVTKSTSDNMNLNVKIVGLDKIDSTLKNNIYIDYSLYSETDNGDGTYTDKSVLIKSADGYSDDKLLSNMASENIFTSPINVSGTKTYAIYYTIGLKEEANIGEVTNASLGRFSITGTVAE